MRADINRQQDRNSDRRYSSPVRGSPRMDAVLVGLERMLGHASARLLILGACFVALSLPVLSGRAARPSLSLLLELFVTWTIVIVLLAVLAAVDRRRAAREAPGTSDTSMTSERAAAEESPG